ncbi:uncharacterized protein LOC119675692 [Teleopsis dalmanni]|uniref:uncharacterized protein LOC119675542 n=1 Tax=Teleopsis dalmanni TaxID=139649 RepID=UPI0018CD83FB|nr:uncharacterized protein LOC119675542 [Teleopsis dalmanni]XP_037942827.1 uncharacterized protein LOC119675692 [Teleopsis dalmanni]
MYGDAFSILSEKSGKLKRIEYENRVKEVLDIFESASSSESDSEPEQHEKCSSFESTIEAMSAQDFKQHFRLKRETIEVIITRFSQSEYFPNQFGGGRQRVTAGKSFWCCNISDLGYSPACNRFLDINKR